ncbi:MAG TPA: hypothetical protein VGE74_14480 [Gemmata sp.]
MTEAEWLAADEPERMFVFLGDRVSLRKWRLFACACCRRHWHWVEDTPAATAVEVAERFADGRAAEKKLRAAQEQAQVTATQFYADYRQTLGVEPHTAHLHASACAVAALPPSGWRGTPHAALRAAHYAAQTYACEANNSLRSESAAWLRDRAAETAMQASVLRDIVGNPFRPARFNPAWQTADVRFLAEGIYAERAFDRLPILADALQDAGCDSEDLLTHFRDPALLPWDHPDGARGPAPVSHALGCWALDRVLGFS